MVFPLPYHSTSIPGAVFRLGLGAQTDTASVLPVCRTLSCGIITARFCEDEISVAERDSSEISRVLSLLGIEGALMTEAFQFVAILSCTLFAGAALYINLAEHPARMQCGTELAATVFGPSYHRATAMQVPLALAATVLGLDS